jgi:hypothetical protein
MIPPAISDTLVFFDEPFLEVSELLDFRINGVAHGF